MKFQKIFPFTAIVGQESMKRALILNAVEPRIGGVLIRGERGTAKSTAARALSALLPEVKVVSGCRFSCDPETKNTWCTECQERFKNGEEVPVTIQKTSFVNLPVSATEDRVVGTIDIEKAIQKGERSFEPGILAAAKRSLLYIDEVNLLDDHVVDVLLDSAAMGMNSVEREGISFVHPARFILVGTMNPEEGDLRPQLLDRFALSVDIQGISIPQDRVTIMERNMLFDRDPEGFYNKWRPQEEELSERIVKGRELIDKVQEDQSDFLAIATLTSALGVDGHRPDLVILKTARANAAFEGRLKMANADIAQAAHLTLGHRLKRGPFDKEIASKEDLEHRIQQLVNNRKQTGLQPQPSQNESGSDMADQGKKNLTDGGVTSENQVENQQPRPNNEEDTQDEKTDREEGGKIIEAKGEFEPKTLQSPKDRQARSTAGKRSVTRTTNKRGRYILSRPARGNVDDLAFDATIRSAAPFQLQRSEQRKRVAFAIQPQDYMRKIRVRRTGNLILFVVDASWSMAVAERMAAAKGAILSLLNDAYQRRDRVGMIAFQRENATLILPPTNSVTLAERALEDIPVGGKTPLSAGKKIPMKSSCARNSPTRMCCPS